MKKIVLLSVSTFILLTSCHKPLSFEYKGIKNFKLDQLGFNKSKVSMDLIYFNPNDFGVELKKVDCAIYINNSYLGKYLLDTTLRINRKSEFILPSSMEVDMKDIFKNGVAFLLNKEVLVKAVGTSKVGKSGIFFTVPINYEARQALALF